ncbi:MAG TPA: hypothetical protein VEK82_03755 [Stellaceae bacterium]|nr:hypothetical protein [Stellaceae bacterium]
MFEKLLRSLTSLRLTGGIFTKTIYLLIVLSICVTLVSIVLSIWWFALILMIFLFGLVFYAMQRLFNFTDKYPFAAIMEGPELLRLEEMRQGKKGQEDLPLSPPTIEHEPPPMPEAEITAPDPPPQLSIGPDETPPSQKEC